MMDVTQDGHGNDEDMGTTKATSAPNDEEGEEAAQAMDGEAEQKGKNAEQGETEVKGRSLPVSLARVLFLSCDACIYCGGKFVG